MTAPRLNGDVRTGTSVAVVARNLQVPQRGGRWGWSRASDPRLRVASAVERVPHVFGLPRVAAHGGGPWQYFDGQGMVTRGGVFSYPAGWVEGCAPSDSVAFSTCGGRIVFHAAPTIFDSTVRGSAPLAPADPSP